MMEDDATAEPNQDLEDPTHVGAHGSADKNSRTKAPGADAGDDSDDDATPDYSALATLAKKMQAGQAGSGLHSLSSDGTAASGRTGVPFIPKRGEKDFEPTGFVAQAKALEASRKAMFDVIRCERQINSKSVSVATWESKLNRAIVQLARGQTFGSVGYANRVQILEDGQFADLAELRRTPGEVLAQPAGTFKDGTWWPKMQSRLELYPEEALYLVERGSLECRTHSHDVGDAKHFAAVATDDMLEYEGESHNTNWVPMSVEQAYASMLYKDDLTRERYQLYAHLKRLGYIVQRKSLTDALRATAFLRKEQYSGELVETRGIVADPKRPLPLVSIFDVLLYPGRRCVQIMSDIISGCRRIIATLIEKLRARANQTVGSLWLPRAQAAAKDKLTSGSAHESAGRGLLGIGAPDIRSYEAAYDRLRIVPADHDYPLSTTHGKSSKLDLQIFFYAWRPATHFKKTAPPLPEFQLATADARVTDLPSVYAFGDLFAQLPRAISNDEVADLNEDEQRELRRAQEEKKRNDESYGRGAVRKKKAEQNAARAISSDQTHPWFVERLLGMYSATLSPLLPVIARMVSLLDYIGRIVSHLPPGCSCKTDKAGRGKFGRTGPSHGIRRPPNVYVPLKAGRRNVIVAVNDCGTMSLLRFGESEFTRWRLAGTRAP